MKAVVATFSKEKALVGALSVHDCETSNFAKVRLQLYPAFCLLSRALPWLGPALLLVLGGAHLVLDRGTHLLLHILQCNEYSRLISAPHLYLSPHLILCVAAWLQHLGADLLVVRAAHLLRLTAWARPQHTHHLHNTTYRYVWYTIYNHRTD